MGLIGLHVPEVEVYVCVWGGGRGDEGHGGMWGHGLGLHAAAKG